MTGRILPCSHPHRGVGTCTHIRSSPAITLGSLTACGHTLSHEAEGLFRGIAAEVGSYRQRTIPSGTHLFLGCPSGSGDRSFCFRDGICCGGRGHTLNQEAEGLFRGIAAEVGSYRQ